MEVFEDEIYDLPSIHVKRLSIVVIEDLNVNACSKKYSKRTGEIRFRG